MKEVVRGQSTTAYYTPERPTTSSTSPQHSETSEFLYETNIACACGWGQVTACVMDWLQAPM